MALLFSACWALSRLWATFCKASPTCYAVPRHKPGTADQQCQAALAGGAVRCRAEGSVRRECTEMMISPKMETIMPQLTEKAATLALPLMNASWQVAALSSLHLAASWLTKTEMQVLSLPKG